MLLCGLLAASAVAAAAAAACRVPFKRIYVLHINWKYNGAGIWFYGAGEFLLFLFLCLKCFSVSVVFIKSFMVGQLNMQLIHPPGKAHSYTNTNTHTHTHAHKYKFICTHTLSWPAAVYAACYVARQAILRTLRMSNAAAKTMPTSPPPHGTNLSLYLIHCVAFDV